MRQQLGRAQDFGVVELPQRLVAECNLGDAKAAEMRTGLGQAGDPCAGVKWYGTAKPSSPAREVVSFCLAVYRRWFRAAAQTKTAPSN